jgi:hypothetical protein
MAQLQSRGLQETLIKKGVAAGSRIPLSVSVLKSETGCREIGPEASTTEK